MDRVQKNIFKSLLNSPRIFNPFSRYLGDHNIVTQVIKDELDLTSKKRLLDLGCGTGNLSRMFPSEIYTGVDFNKNYVDFARKRYNKNFLVMDAANLEFNDNYFDLIFVKDVFHHIADNIFLKVLSEMKRVLKPKGQVLIVEISFRLSDDLLYKKVIRKLDRGRYIREFSILQESILGYLRIHKCYIKKGIWGDLAVFLMGK